MAFIVYICVFIYIFLLPVIFLFDENERYCSHQKLPKRFYMELHLTEIGFEMLCQCSSRLDYIFGRGQLVPYIATFILEGKVSLLQTLFKKAGILLGYI